MSHSRNSLTAALTATLIVAVVVLARSIPAAASAPASYQGLVPASPATSIKKLDTITVTGTCPIADSNARITAEYPIEWPAIALAQNASPATSTVLIDLDNRGTLINARIASSSGNLLFDEEALLGARMSKYAPEVHKCATAARSYYLDVKFELAD